MSDTAKVRVGIIGCGGISKAHLAGLSKFEDVELAAFCDIVVERAQAHSQNYTEGKAPAYDDAEKMFAGTALDAAYIMIPTFQHGRPERACLAAKVPFLVEKPLGIDPEDLRKLKIEVAQSGLITAAGFMNRYRTSVNRAKDALASDPAILLDGAWIGGPPLVKEGDYFSQNPIGQWWPIKERSGGQFVEQVIHTVDLVRYLAGEVEEVYCYGTRAFNRKHSNLIPNYNIEDAAVVSMKFENGAVGNIMAACSVQKGGGVFLNVYAAKHTAKFTDWAHHLVLHSTEAAEPEEVKGDTEDIFPLEDRTFIDAIKSKDASKIRANHSDGVRTTLLCLAANESLATGQPVKVKYE